MQDITVGFTGNRDGFNRLQRAYFIQLFEFLTKGKKATFRHGDCVGSDDQAADFVHQYFPDAYIICHPPTIPDLRAYNKWSNELLEEKTYLARNRDIVNNSTVMIGVPRENKRQTRGGTWYTIDYTLKVGKTVNILYPDGTVFEANENYIYR